MNAHSDELNLNIKTAGNRVHRLACGYVDIQNTGMCAHEYQATATYGECRLQIHIKRTVRQTYVCIESGRKVEYLRR